MVSCAPMAPCVRAASSAVSSRRAPWALPAQGFVDPEMIHLQPAQGNGASNAASHPVVLVPQEQGQGDQRQRAGLLDDVSPQTGGDVVGTRRAGFFVDFDLHAVASRVGSAVAACLRV